MKKLLLVAFVGMAATSAHAAKKVELDPTQVDCLRKNVYWEGRNQDEAGMIAIAIVTLNRVGAKNYPDTICGVVHDAVRNARGLPVRNKCQFSWYCDGLADTPHPEICTQFNYTTRHGKKVRYNNKNFNAPECAAWKKSYKIAVGVLRGYLKVRGLEKALYYHNTDVDPDWADPDAKLARIDGHIFYSAALVAATPK